jgi:hypothetical protein
MSDDINYSDEDKRRVVIAEARATLARLDTKTAATTIKTRCHDHQARAERRLSGMARSLRAKCDGRESESHAIEPLLIPAQPRGFSYASTLPCFWVPPDARGIAVKELDRSWSNNTAGSSHS